jgi:dihydroorotase
MDNLDEFSIKNINNVYNAPNETLNQYTINRNLVKLYENDKKMNELKEFISLNNIKTYIPNYAYKKNDIVWFKTKSPLTNKNEVFILRSIISDNIHTPEAKINEKNIITFEESGWMDC